MSSDKVIAMDCPICMDTIEGLNNRVMTECGHTFHCSCLMTNIAHNGFGCPYCRTEMAEEPEEDLDEDEEDEDEEETIFDDDVLTSFRMFQQQVNGDEVEEEPVEDWETVDENEEEQTDAQHPDSAYVTKKLIERGITFEDLVKNILFQEHSELESIYNDHERRSNEIYGQFRAVISQYRPEPSPANPTATPTPANPTPANPTPATEHAEAIVAEPKLPRARLLNVHV
jgi:hypothetical protein